MTMNKLILVFTVLVSAGCQQLQHGQMQPVKMLSSKGVYFTTCAGAVETWSDCYEKASSTCKGKYDVISKGDNSRGTQRDLTFECKK